jgi:DNA-binding IclR family transcriptional regulator
MNPAPATSEHSTTVDRAGTLLLLLARHPDGLGISHLARELDTQRAPLGRILQSLMRHRLVRRDENKKYLLGVGTLELAHAYSSRLPGGLDAVLAALAEQTEMTAMLIEADGDVMTTVLAKTPSTAAEHVYTPPGFRHPSGPLSIRNALAAHLPPRDDDSDEVREARRRGYAVGLGKIMPGRYSAAVAVPGTVTSTSPLIVAVVSFREFDPEAVGEPLIRAAQTIAFTSH